ncbi:MAG: hypothetical protein AAFX99_00470 [Myxococcota bacterium]
MFPVSKTPAGTPFLRPKTMNAPKTVPSSSSSALPSGGDPYEQDYMTQGAVLDRHKMVAPWPFHLLMGLVAVLTSVVLPLWTLSQGDPAWWITLAMTPLLLAAWMMFSALRVSVTQDHVHVQYGLFGPKIDIGSIELCEAEDYALWKYGGYGIRYSVIEGAWCYNMIGDQGQAVRIHYRTRGGGLRKILIASHHPQALADSINRARIAAGTLEDPLADLEGLESAINEAARDTATPTEASSSEPSSVEEASTEPINAPSSKTPSDPMDTETASATQANADAAVAVPAEQEEVAEVSSR